MAEMEKPWFKSWPEDVPKHLDYPAIPLNEILEKTARNHTEKTAIAYMENEISYGELDSYSCRFAGALSGLGVKEKDRVAIYLPNIPQFVIAYFGILKAGAVVTAISPLHKERELHYQLNDSGASLIISLDSLLPIVNGVRQKTGLKKIIVTSSNEYASKTGTPPAEFNEKAYACSFQTLLRESEPKASVKRVNPAADLAALQYTGGTTGTVKAAMLTHMNLISDTIMFAAWIRGRLAKETFLTALPLFHIYGMTTSMNVPIHLAAKIVLVPSFHVKSVLAAIQNYRVTVFCGVPTMYAALLKSPRLDRSSLVSLRVCISGASPLQPWVQEEFMRLSGGLLAEGYGLTEASPVTHCSPVGKKMGAVRAGSIGLPLPDTESKIIDLKTGEETASGETGELVVKGPQVMKGYWGNPEETAVVLRNGWLRTGDIARMDEDGYFYITDRKKDLIKHKDYSVYPHEIENVLCEHPDVKLCAVVGRPTAKDDEVPKAFVVLKEGARTKTEELIEFVNARIASYKAVQELEIRESLPLNSVGKVLKRLLHEEEKNKPPCS